jgi:protocatechuate 3,4-dioxygenase beta subunit
LEHSPPPPPKQKRKTYPVNPDEKSATRSPDDTEEPSVAIYVLASGSKPLPGAVVQLFTGGNECGRSISDKNGKTVFDRLEPGNYVIKIARRDYEPRTQSLTIGDRPPDPIKIVLSKASGAP